MGTTTVGDVDTLSAARYPYDKYGILRISGSLALDNDAGDGKILSLLLQVFSNGLEMKGSYGEFATISSGSMLHAVCWFMPWR